MYIKSITLDDFKSYRNYVEILNFDREFNAITGSNSTGKSNILESICFVLGINLSNGQASLKQVINNHGDPGIAKAVVRITFNNSNSDQQPMGYNCSEITISRQVIKSGRTRYTVNGLTVKHDYVAQLFNSVGLNVNKPHFLIKPGHITKVLNMVPLEIFSMMEDAIGITTYEAQKRVMLKNFAKKDARLIALNKNIKEIVEPQIEKLTAENNEYDEYQRLTEELNQLNKLYAAWQHYALENRSVKIKERVLEIQEIKKTKKEDSKTAKKELKKITRKIANLKKALEEISGGSEELGSANDAMEAGVVVPKQDVCETQSDQVAVDKLEASEAAEREAMAARDLKKARILLRNEKNKVRAGGEKTQLDRDRASLADHQSELEALKAQLSEMSISSERIESLRASILLTNSRRCVLLGILSRFAFRYSTPPNFDHSSVLGTVFRLFEVKDTKYCVALESVAGKMLYNVVVDKESTSQLLLKHGELVSKPRIISLDKITSSPIDVNIIEMAQQIGGGPQKVQLALDLITFEPIVAPVMACIFGNTLVCYDSKTAKRVTYGSSVIIRTVTLDGAVIDPINSPANDCNQGPSVLALKAELGTTVASLARYKSALDDEQRNFDDYQALSKRYEMKSFECEVKKSRLASVGNAQLYAEIEDVVKQVQEITKSIKRSKGNQKKTATLAKTLEEYLARFKDKQEREYKEEQQKLKLFQKRVELFDEPWTKKKEEYEMMLNTLEELERYVEKTEDTQDLERHAVEKLQMQHKTVAKLNEKTAEATTEMQPSIASLKDEKVSRSEVLKKLLARKEEVESIDAAAVLEVIKLDEELRVLQDKLVKYQKKIASLEMTWPWIPAERENFGKVGGIFDFKARGSDAIFDKLKELTLKKKSLKKTFNVSAQIQLIEEEKTYKDLMAKKLLLEASRKMEMQRIAEAANKRQKILEEACERLNGNFTSILSMLYPGAEARLTPKEGCNVQDGLEVHVSINGVWRKSFAELEGNERSLAALALVLAVLLFNPSPIYILDEVDADLDDAQKLRMKAMLRRHFKNSQFIMVTLKDGMAKSAKVLFRTLFANGMSSVQRIFNK